MQLLTPCCFLLTEGSPGLDCLTAYPICNQRPPFSELRCWSEVGWFTRHVTAQGRGTLLHVHEGPGTTKELVQQELAVQPAPFVWVFCFSQPILSGTVGLFLARGEDYMSKIILGCAVLVVYREVHAFLCPQNNLEMNSTVVLLTLFKTAFPLSSHSPDFLSPGDLSQDNSLHYFSLFLPGFQPQCAFLSICNSFHQARF